MKVKYLETRYQIPQGTNVPDFTKSAQIQINEIIYVNPQVLFKNIFFMVLIIFKTVCWVHNSDDIFIDHFERGHLRADIHVRIRKTSFYMTLLATFLK